MAFPPGTRIGAYEIISSLGAGAVGEVYRAHDTKLGRDVAIKFLSTDVASESARRRFQQEARTASSLNHPHILVVHDADEIDGRQYIVTEFVDVIPLAPNTALPAWPRGGISSDAEARQLPNVKVLDRSIVFPGPTPSLFAFQRRRVHRNIYRVTIEP